METGEASQEGRKVSTWLVPVIGYGVSLASLWWAFARFPFAQLGDHLRTMAWGWLALAIVAELISFFLDAWRWRELLRPAILPPYGAAVQGVFAGLFANDVLPARAGEAVRCFLLSYKADVHLPLVITSVIILRVLDGIWIAVIYFATYRVVEHVEDVTRFMLFAWTPFVGLMTSLLLFVLFRRQHADNFVSNSSWAARFAHFLDEIHNLGNWRELRIVMMISGFYWTLQICAVWAITRADNCDFVFSQMAFLLIFKNVGTLLPTAPAGIGAFQASAIYALQRFLTEPSEAKVLAEFLFVFLTLPGLIGGAIAVAMAGYNLNDLVRHAQEAHAKHRCQKP